MSIRSMVREWLGVQDIERIQVVSMAKDDIIVLQCNERLSQETANAVRAKWGERFGTRAVVLDKGLSIGCVLACGGRHQPTQEFSLERKE